MKTTLGKIKAFAPCCDGWGKLCRNVGSTDESTEVSLSQILDSNGIQAAFWSLRCWDYRDYCLLLADVIEPVLPFNGCYAVVDMSNTIRKWHAGEITDNDLAAASAAASAAARDAASAAASAAAWAARGAASAAASAAARDAAKTAAWAARDAASAAARAAEGAAAKTAAWAASAAARAAEGAATWAATWGRIEKLMREFIEKGQTNGKD